MDGAQHDVVDGGRGPLPLDAVRECFGWLTCGPKAMVVDGRAFRGLPNRPLRLDELRRRLLTGRVPLASRDAVWAYLVARSRREGGSWTLACAGMALPALARLCKQPAPGYPGDVFDVHAEVLGGFLSGLAHIDVTLPHVMGRLRWCAHRAGQDALREARRAPTPTPPGFWSAPPPLPARHPDLVPARAVRLSVLSRTEADLIGSTRVGDESVADWATARRVRLKSAYQTRRRAERRLVAFLHDQIGQGRDRDADPVGTYVLDETGRAPGGNSALAEGAVSKKGRSRALLGCGRSTPSRTDSSPRSVPGGAWCRCSAGRS